METMIRQYQNAKREHDECAEWAALIGKEYHGGGGGIGELKSMRLASGDDVNAPNPCVHCVNERSE
jgi:hypothetical protein